MKRSPIQTKILKVGFISFGSTGQMSNLEFKQSSYGISKIGYANVDCKQQNSKMVLKEIVPATSNTHALLETD